MTDLSHQFKLEDVLYDFMQSLPAFSPKTGVSEKSSFLIEMAIMLPVTTDVKSAVEPQLVRAFVKRKELIS